MLVETETETMRWRWKIISETSMLAEWDQNTPGQIGLHRIDSDRGGYKKRQEKTEQTKIYRSTIGYRRTWQDWIGHDKIRWNCSSGRGIFRFWVGWQDDEYQFLPVNVSKLKYFYYWQYALNCVPVIIPRNILIYFSVMEEAIHTSILRMLFVNDI